MTIQTITLDAIDPSRGNPRKAVDRAAIEGLAASIKADGLLQNIVVKPVNGKGERFRIVSGERRYRALKLLSERGDLPEDFTVPAEVRTGLGKDDTLRLATVENLQRRDLTPLEETDALTKLIHGKVTLEDIAAKTGLSVSTIKRRLALNGLSDEAKAALSEGTITLAQAEALTLGDHDRQKDVLDRIGQGYYVPDADDIREHMIDCKPSVADAIFPVEEYIGTITTDLFAEAETSYFDDEDQFMALQKEAVDALVNHHAESAAWVEVSEAYSIPVWQYREAEDGEEAGVLINLSPSGKVEVREGLVKRDIPDRTVAELSASPAAQKPKASYPTPLRRYIAYHKTAAVQEMLLSDPRKALEVSVTKMLHRFEPHEALPAFADDVEPQQGYRVLEQVALDYAAKLGFEADDQHSVWERFPPAFTSAEDLYEAVKALSDEDLNGLHILLTALALAAARRGS